MSARLHELIFNPCSRKAIGKVAHGLVVGEVGLHHPAFGLGSTNLVDEFTGMFNRAHRDFVLASHRTRPQNLTCRFNLGQLGAVLVDKGSQRERKFFKALMGHCGNREDRPPENLEIRANDIDKIATIGNIDLVEDDDAGALHEGNIALNFAQITLVCGQFGFNCA